MTRFILIIAAIAALFLLSCAARAEEARLEVKITATVTSYCIVGDEYVSCEEMDVMVVSTPIECPPDCEWFED